MKKKQFWVKVMVWILAVLMAGSCALMLFQFLPAGAAELDATATVEETVAVEETASVEETDAVEETTSAEETTLEEADTAEELDAVKENPEYVTVGLMYGSDVTVGFETVSTVGFSVHAVTADKTERSYKEIYTVELPKISVVCDDNLSKTAYTYSIYNTSKACVVGGYHIEVAEDFETREGAEAVLALVKEMLLAEGSDMHPFIAYINGAYKVRIGDYSSVERIEKKIASVPELAEAIELDIAKPSKTALMIVDPETDVIYFEFDCGKSQKLGLCALDKGGEKQYLKTPANRLYDGVFVYSRYQTQEVDGVALTNMLPIEEYIKGVVPYEISPTWHYEALRSFAITVRGYTVQSKNRHYASYGFDICNNTHCQVYKGVSSINQNVIDAVDSTKGLVLSDGKSIVTTYYSSSTGGYTASAKDTWGGDDSPYLVPTYTPWERYSEHGNGLWITEVSGKELADTLREKGYDVKGDRIVDININAFSGDSPYVYSITYTDSKGKELTITRCDKVRTSISKYVKSANFIVGKGSLTYEYDKVISVDMQGTYSSTTWNYLMLDEEAETVKVLTANGVEEVKKGRVYVQKSNQVTKKPLSELPVATGGSGYYYDLYSKPGVILRRITETYTAKDEDSFIFAGKGWGHGVGLSQFGMLDLAESGAMAEEILSLYFPALSLIDYHEIKGNY